MGLFTKKEKEAEKETKLVEGKASNTFFNFGKKTDQELDMKKNHGGKYFNQRKSDRAMGKEKVVEQEGKKEKNGSKLKKPKKQEVSSGQAYTMFNKPIKGNLLAIDLMDLKAKLVLAKNKKNNLEILQVVDVDMPDSAIINGDIIDQEAVYQALRSAIDSHNLGAKYAFFSINGERIIRREIRIPKVDEKDIEGLINFELEQYLDIDTESYIIEFEIMDTPSLPQDELMDTYDDEGSFLDILVYAVPKGMVENRFEIAKRLKLTPYVLDIHSNGLEKWLERVESINQVPVALVEKNIGFIQISNQTVDVYLYAKGKFITNNHTRINYQFIIDVFEREDRLKRIKDIQQSDHQYQGVINTINEWTTATKEHIIATEDFFNRSQAEAIDNFYIYGNDDVYVELVPFLEKQFGRSLTHIEDAQLKGISWTNANAHTCTPDLIQATAMLIRRA